MMVIRFGSVVAAALLVLAQGSPPARAQLAPAAAGVADGGIRVLGYGSARIAVKTAEFVAYAHGSADTAEVLRTMKAAGIDDATLGAPQPGIASGATTLHGTIRGLSAARLEAIASAAAAFVRTHPGTSIDNVQFGARLDDCAADEQTARVAALADARRKAAAIAAAAGVTLGAVGGVVESGGCTRFGPSRGNPTQPLDLDTLTTTVSVTESVTYTIVEERATRRRTL